MIRIFLLLTTAFYVQNCQSRQTETDAPEKPNIIYILADDLGYGDISAFNPNGKIQTKHIDQLAQNGIKFTDAHSNSAVCTPTRYSLLTGRYAWRTRLKKGVTWSWDTLLIDKGRTTVGTLLQKHGYHTACIGKWHLGLGWQTDSAGTVDVRKPLRNGPNDVGFDYFFGIPAPLDIPPYVYIVNSRSTTQNIDTVDKNEGKGLWRRGPIGDDLRHLDVLPTFTRKAVDHIRKRAKADQPFFLYFPLPAPHTPILPTPEFQGKSGINEYGDFVLMVDDVVGQIVQALEENQLIENTLVIVTSDNGCSPIAEFEELAEYGHDPSYIYRGHKADIFEGGHRVPFIAHWPKKIKAGQLSDQTICHTDLLATCAAILGDSLHHNEGEDSYNLLPLLLGKAQEKALREATVLHSVVGVFAIRKGKWKLIFGPGSGGWSYPTPAKAIELGLPPIQLYDLQQDSTEANNLAKNEPEIVEELTSLMNQYIDSGRSTRGPALQNDTETRLYRKRPNN